MIVTKKDKIPIAWESVRVVHGGRGDYIEIDDSQIISPNLHIPISQAWRRTNEWKDKVYYYWWETVDGVKLYYQKKTVDYADYKVGFWYVAPDDVEEVTDD